jgi:hypothetical protein
VKGASMNRSRVLSLALIAIAVLGLTYLRIFGG